MHDFRTKDYYPISNYELKDFLENVFSRETAEYILDLDAFEECRVDDPKSVNAEYLDHLYEHYDCSQDKKALTDKVNDIIEDLDDLTDLEDLKYLKGIKKKLENLKDFVNKIDLIVV